MSDFELLKILEIWNLAWCIGYKIGYWILSVGYKIQMLSKTFSKNVKIQKMWKCTKSCLKMFKITILMQCPEITNWFKN